MKARRTKVRGGDAVYHCMSRVVSGERLFGDREKEMLRKMIWRVADFCGVEVLTYCVMTNHFHVLLRVPQASQVSDAELMRRYRILYPKPTVHQTASIAVMEAALAKGGEEAEAIRRRLMARMSDVSEYMKTLKQRFSIWYNRSHQRYGTLWAERFKSVLVEGRGDALQTMAAYIDLNPVRAGIVEDPKDYRFCGYAEALSGGQRASAGIRLIWAAHTGKGPCGNGSKQVALQMHRELIFGKRAAEGGISEMSRKQALKVLQEERGQLPISVVLRCRIRYFSDGAILGSEEFVRGFVQAVKEQRGRKHLPKPQRMRGADWGDLTVIQGLRSDLFG